MFQFLAIFCCGTFFGAALYITLVQHPAVLDAGTAFAGRFFPPMYKRAAVLQVVLAVTGTVASLIGWLQGAGAWWLIGALLLFAVVPFTLVRMHSLVEQLLKLGPDADASLAERLLREWGTLHAVRTLLSGLAFAILLASV